MSALLGRRAAGGGSGTGDGGREGREQLLEEALGLVNEGLSHCPFDAPLVVQQGSLLRRLGRQGEALERAWAALAYHREQEHHRPLQQQPSAAGLASAGGAAAASSPVPLHVLMVKWGTKYPADHANRLAAAVRRHLRFRPLLRVLCLTDDAAGLDMGVIDGVVEFPPHHGPLQGWWAKAALFSPALPIPPGMQPPRA